MPRILFDHLCRSCGAGFEELVNTQSEEAITCPECQSPYTKRLITGSRIDSRLGVDASSYPTLGDKWARIRKQRQQIEAKRARENGE